MRRPQRLLPRPQPGYPTGGKHSGTRADPVPLERDGVCEVTIDVVVPAYNAEGYIGACLDGLFAAGFAPDRITVVDDGSTDGTSAICRGRGVAPVSMGRNTSAAVARNAGARTGRGTVLFFVDADVVVAPDSRAVLIRWFAEHPDHAAMFGAYDPTPAAPGRVSRIRNLLHRHVHIAGAGPAVTFWTGCGAVRRAAFEAVGGFDETIAMMEDVDLGLRLAAAGHRIEIDPALQGKHLKAWSLLGMARTDLLHRAIPWARLLTGPAAQGLPRTLNIDARGRTSVLSVGASLLGLPLLVVAPAAGAVWIAAALGLMGWANRGFLARLRREGRPGDAAAALPVLWVHYLCGGLGYAWVRLAG